MAFASALALQPNALLSKAPSCSSAASGTLSRAAAAVRPAQCLRAGPGRRGRTQVRAQAEDFKVEGVLSQDDMMKLMGEENPEEVDLNSLTYQELTERLAKIENQIEAFDSYYGEEENVEDDWGDEEANLDDDEDEGPTAQGEEGELGDQEEDEFEAEVIQVSRVTKVVKGGKQIGFRAVVVLGNSNGTVGLGCDSGKEVAQATERAWLDAKKNLISFPLTPEKSIPHRVDGIWGAAKVMLRPAAAGTGAISGGAVSTVLELAGIENCLAKQLGSTNLLNNARATIQGLSELRTFEEVADLRDLTLEELLGSETAAARYRTPGRGRPSREEEVEPAWAGMEDVDDEDEEDGEDGDDEEDDE